MGKKLIARLGVSAAFVAAALWWLMIVPAVAQPTEGFAIRAKGTNQCLAVPAGNAVAGQDLWLAGCDGSQSQRFKWSDRLIRHVDSGLCVRIERNGKNGTPVQLGNCVSMTARASWVNSQVWSIHRDDQLAARGNRCLDVEGVPDTHTPLIVDECGAGATGWSYDHGPAEVPPEPTGPASPNDGGCLGGGCTALDPAELNCGGDNARTTAVEHLAGLEVRHSLTCDADWLRGGSSLTGRFVHLVGYTCADADASCSSSVVTMAAGAKPWSPMLSARFPHMRVCVSLNRGVADLGDCGPPFSDYVRIEGPAGAYSTADALVAVAVREHERWDLPGVGARRVETHSWATPVLREYAADGAGWRPWTTQPNSWKTAQPWSAAFISWVVKEAGVSDFAFSRRHFDYVVDAYRNVDDPAAGFWAYDWNAVPVQLGDLVCNDRHRNSSIDLADLPGEDGRSMHCDVVVAVHDSYVEVIGGNTSDRIDGVSHTVGRKNRSTRNGYLSGTTDWVAIVRPR